MHAVCPVLAALPLTGLVYHSTQSGYRLVFCKDVRQSDLSTCSECSLNLQLLESAALREDNNERAEGSGNGDDDDQDALQSHVAVISAAAVPVQQTFTNQSAGVDAAMQLLRLTQSLQGTITAADYDTLLEVCLADIVPDCQHCQHC